MDPLPPPVPVVAPPWHTPERRGAAARARQFAAERVLPVADELDPLKAEIPRSLLGEMAGLGYFGIMVDREYGGMGLGAFEYCLVAEELARAWMSVGSIIARAQGAGTGVADPDPPRRAAATQRAGQWIGAIALSEPDAGSDLAAVATRAVRDGDEFVLTGRKRWCGNAVAADFIDVLCGPPTRPGREASRGPRHGAAGEGARQLPGRRHRHTDRQDRLPRVRHLRPRLRRPARAGGQPGSATAGFAAVEQWLNIARVQTAARAVGLARAAVEDTIGYLQDREQFEHPIGDFQAVRFKLAEMAARVERLVRTTARSATASTAGSRASARPRW